MDYRINYYFENCIAFVCMYARMKPDVKEQAESILSVLGISASNAMNMFYKQIILNRGLPFEVKIPTAGITSESGITGEQLNAELEKGYGGRENKTCRTGIC